MDAFEGVLRPRPNHTIDNHKGVKNINKFKPMKPSVEYLDGHENQNSNENLQFRHNKPYPIHFSLCVSSFKVLVSINVGHYT
jgi:hypothetical protein